MEFSWIYQQSLTSIFHSNEDDTATSPVDCAEFITLNDSTVYDKFLSVNIGESEIEVPVFCRNRIEEFIYDKLQYPSISGSRNIKEIIVPLYCNTMVQNKRTADSIIKEFFTKTNFGNRLQKVVTNKGEIYYGGKGIILNKDFTPLFIATLIGEKEVVDGNTVFTYNRGTIHVNPKVFLDISGLISKSILKKVIPLYVSKTIRINTNSGFRSNLPISYTPQILIDDVSGWIKRVKLPTPSNCSNDVLNQFLIDNIDDVLNQIGE